MTVAMKSEDICFLAESYDKPRQCVEKQRHYSADKGPYSQGYGLPSRHIQLCELDCKEGRTPKNRCLGSVVLKKTPESPLDNKEIKPVNLKGNQPWILIGRTDTEAPVFRLSDADSWLIGKDPDAGKDWGQKEKRASENEMAGWHHQCNGHERGQTSGDGDGLGALVCCSLWGHKESDMTGWLKNNNNTLIVKVCRDGVPWHKNLIYWYCPTINHCVWSYKINQSYLSKIVAMSNVFLPGWINTAFRTWCVAIHPDGNVRCSHYGKLCGGTLKIKNSTTIWSSNSTSGYDFEDKIINLKWYLHPHICFSIIHNSQDKETMEVSMAGWMDKENVIYVITGILLSHKIAWNLALASAWMYPEGIVQVK